MAPKYEGSGTTPTLDQMAKAGSIPFGKADDLSEAETVVLTPDPRVVLAETINAVFEQWFMSHIHGSAVSQSTPAVNHLRQSLPALHAAIMKEV